MAGSHKIQQTRFFSGKRAISIQFEAVIKFFLVTLQVEGLQLSTTLIKRLLLQVPTFKIFWKQLFYIRPVPSFLWKLEIEKFFRIFWTVILPKHWYQRSVSGFQSIPKPSSFATQYFLNQLRSQFVGNKENGQISNTRFEICPFASLSTNLSMTQRKIGNLFSKKIQINLNSEWDRKLAPPLSSGKKNEICMKLLSFSFRALSVTVKLKVDYMRHLKIALSRFWYNRS